MKELILLPPDLEEEYTPEQMEEAEAEVQDIIDRYYGDMGAKERVI